MTEPPRDERTDASAAFALRLVADLLTGLVLKGVLTKENATALIDEGLTALLQDHAALAPQCREIAATLTAQVQLASVELERRLLDP